RWKSSRELVTASEANCRASDREAGVKEARKRSCGPTNRNRIEGGAEQGERARNREALVTEARRRRSGGRAAKVNVLTRGDLALRLKGRRGPRGLWSEKSAEAVVVAQAAKGRTMRRAKRLRTSREIMPQKSDQGPSARTVGAVKPQGSRMRVEAPPVGSGDERLGSGYLMEQACERENLW